MKNYIVLLLCNNEVQYIKPFTNLTNAETQAVSLANEWYKREGLESFGKVELETFKEMQAYYYSEAYLESRDGVHICVEEILLDLLSYYGTN